MQVPELPGILRISWRPTGYPNAAAALGRLPIENRDLLVVDICGRLMALGYHSQFVYLSNPLDYCFIFDPADRLQPSISDIAANLEITSRVNT